MKFVVLNFPNPSAHFLKRIKRSFVKDLPEDEDDREIASLIITLAHKLKRKVVAEGVETEGQAAFLQSQGCDYAQGYLFGRPLPADEFIALMAAQSKQRDV